LVTPWPRASEHDGILKEDLIMAESTRWNVISIALSALSLLVMAALLYAFNAIAQDQVNQSHAREREASLLGSRLSLCESATNWQERDACRAKVQGTTPAAPWGLPETFQTAQQ
jgi:hypothetical protein